MAETLPGILFDILRGSTSKAVGGTNVAYTKSFPLPRNSSFGWDVQFDSPGVVNVKVELEQSDVRPVTEESADTTNWTIPLNKSTPMIAAVTDELVNKTAYAPNASAFGRLKLTGLNSGTTNDAGTVLTRARMYTVKN